MKYFLAIIAACALNLACGGAPERPVDKDSIRRNADDAHGDADREAARKPD